MLLSPMCIKCRTCPIYSPLFTIFPPVWIYLYPPLSCTCLPPSRPLHMLLAHKNIVCSCDKDHELEPWPISRIYTCCLHCYCCSIVTKPMKSMTLWDGMSVFLIYFEYDFFEKIIWVTLSLSIVKAMSFESSSALPPPSPSPPLWPTALLPVGTDTTPQKPWQRSPPQRVAKGSIFLPVIFVVFACLLLWKLWQQGQGFHLMQWKRICAETRGGKLRWKEWYLTT